MALLHKRLKALRLLPPRDPGILSYHAACYQPVLAQKQKTTPSFSFDKWWDTKISRSKHCQWTQAFIAIGEYLYEMEPRCIYSFTEPCFKIDSSELRFHIFGQKEYVWIYRQGWWINKKPSSLGELQSCFTCYIFASYNNTIASSSGESSKQQKGREES